MNFGREEENIHGLSDICLEVLSKTTTNLPW